MADPHPAPPLKAALAGLVLMAAAMGMGRFLYTPALPMMAADAGLDAAAAGLIAGANFLGYLMGAAALGAGWRLGVPPRTLVLVALGVSALSTAAMAAQAGFWPWAWWRWVGGVASAVAMVGGSALVLGHLRATPGWGAVHFAGVGFGILLGVAISGPWAVGPTQWAAVWLVGALASLAAIAFVAWALPPPAPPAPPGEGQGGGLTRLALSYGCLGFGYVITATFLVAMLREAAAGRLAESAVWALVGLAAAPSVWLWDRAARRIGRVAAYRATLAVMGFGVAAGALGALGLAAACLGATFVAATALGLTEAVRRAPRDGRAAIGLMTASFGLGQMLGPVVAGTLREATGSYAAPSLVAALVLAGGVALMRR